jgi:UDP-glucose 4-epimerase
MAKRILITGCSGYLAQRLIDACRLDPEIEWLGGIDVRAPQNTDGLHFFPLDVRAPEIETLLRQNQITTVVHLAWVFNPTHEPNLEYDVDVEGSRNILTCVEKAAVPHLIYLSSTTAYGPHPDNPPIFDEKFPRRGHAEYLYSKYKAEVDHLMLNYWKEHPVQDMFVIRAPIVLGPNTRNVVTQMTELPVLIGIRGYDPPMQFIHEQDLQRLLVWAIERKPRGFYNVVGNGTITYSRIVEILKKPSLWLPGWMIYPTLRILWGLRAVPFPPSILDFIRYPWVASSELFHQTYDFEIQHTSEEAFLAYAHARFKNLTQNVEK